MMTVGGELKLVVGEVFRKHSSLSFVVTVTVERDSSFGPWAPRWKLYRNSRAKCPTTPETENIIELALSRIPPPVQPATWAKGQLRSPMKDVGQSHYGGYRVSSSRVRVSSRGFLEVLAGRRELGEFLADHRLSSYFETQFSEGRTIAEVTVEREPDHDDDWVIITFTGPDPALTPFRPPRSNTEP